MTNNETVVLCAAIILAIAALVFDVHDSALVLVIVTNVFAYLSGKKLGESNNRFNGRE